MEWVLKSLNSVRWPKYLQFDFYYAYSSNTTTRVEVIHIYIYVCVYIYIICYVREYVMCIVSCMHTSYAFNAYNVVCILRV